MTNIVITGANRGIGLALTKQYVAQGAKVWGLCRHGSEDLSRTGAEIIEGIDVSTDDLEDRLRESLSGVDIDILINNAGILRDESLGNINRQTILEQFQVNALGPLRVCDTLVGQMRSGGKIALITSRMGSVDDNTSGGRYGYRMSKSALNIAGKSLAEDLKGKGIAVAILHPGYVQTDMVNFGGFISADESAAALCQRIAELGLENTGTFWHSNGEVLPW